MDWQTDRQTEEEVFFISLGIKLFFSYKKVVHLVYAHYKRVLIVRLWHKHFIEALKKMLHTLHIIP